MASSVKIVSAAVLREGGVSSATARVYRRGYELFVNYVKTNFSITVTASLPGAILDNLLVTYVDYLYVQHQGRMRHLATHAKLGILQELSYRFKHH